VDKAVLDCNSGEIGMSAAQARAAAASGNTNLYMGQVIHSAVKDAVANGPSLPSLYIARSGEFGPDFLDLDSLPGTPRWYDVTTQDSWPAHAKRYAGFGNGTGIFW